MASAGNHEEKLVVDSKVRKEIYQFTWRIAELAEMLTCPEMVTGASIDFEMGHSIELPTKLRAYLSLEEDEKTKKKWVGVYFKALRPTTTDVLLKAKVQIGSYATAEFGTIKSATSIAWGWHMIPEDEKVSKLPLDTDGVLSMDVTVTLYNVPGTTSKLSNLTAEFQERFFQTLSKNMGMLYETPNDFPASPMMIKIVSKDGKEYSANSSILAARSPVFLTMFQTPMSEVKEGVVRIDDIEGEALDGLLHFMHTGVLRENWKQPGILEELTYAAHKYLMQDLLDFLDEAIGLVFTADNCGKMMRLASRLGLKKAEKAMQDEFLEQLKQAGDYEKMLQLFQD